MKNILLLLLCYSIIFSCKKENYSNNNLRLDYQLVLTFNENIDLIGGIHTLNFIDDDTLVVSTVNPTNIYLYSSKGNQIKKIGKLGNGPGEFMSPNLIKIFDNQIYIWDSDNLKLVIYNKSGDYISQYGNFETAIKDFVIYNNFICFYYAGGHSNIMGIYDLSHQKFIHQGIEASQEHILLNVNNCAGGLIIDKNLLIYFSADELTLNSINLNDFRTLNKNILDKEFKVASIQSAHDIINNSRNKMIEYLMVNSFIKDVYQTDMEYIIHSEIGSLNYNEDKSFNNSERKNKFLFINKKTFKIESHYYEDHKFMSNCNYINFNNKVYKLESREDENSYKYSLYEVIFNKS